MKKVKNEFLVNADIVNFWDEKFKGFVLTGRKAMSDESYLAIIAAHIEGQIASKKSNLDYEIRALSQQPWLWDNKVFPQFKPVLRKLFDAYVQNVESAGILSRNKKSAKFKLTKAEAQSLDIADLKTLKQFFITVSHIEQEIKINKWIADYKAGNVTMFPTKGRIEDPNE